MAQPARPTKAPGWAAPKSSQDDVWVGLTELLGARVLAIDKTPVDEVWARVRPLVSCDNELGHAPPSRARLERSLSLTYDASGSSAWPCRTGELFRVRLGDRHFALKLYEQLLSNNAVVGASIRLSSHTPVRLVEGHHVSPARAPSGSTCSHARRSNTHSAVTSCPFHTTRSGAAPA
jgi:hypothetical protein